MNLPAAEPDPVIESYKKDVDRTLIRENLRLTVTERFQKHAALQRFAVELKRAGAAHRTANRDARISGTTTDQQ